MDAKMTETEKNIKTTGEIAAGLMASENGNQVAKKGLFTRIKNFNILDLDEEGRVGPPLLLYFLGVPGGLCVVLWLFFFRGR